jgi:ParB family transcriptional regulator, chromosome partitioning protein
MVEHAAELLAGTGWIPEPLRTPGRQVAPVMADETEAGQVGSDGDPSDARSETKEPVADDEAGEQSAAPSHEPAMADDDAFGHLEQADDAPLIAAE